MMRGGCVVIALAACVTGPNNGTPVGGEVVGASLTYDGYTDKPNELVTLEVMVRPDVDPSLPSSWVAFGSARTSSSPTYIQDPVPLYAWRTVAAPVATAAEAVRWARGGVVRTRVKRANGGILSTFDEPTYLDCVISHYAAGDGWQVIGPACGGVTTKASGRVSGVVGLASTVRTPLDLPANLKPDWLGRKGDATAAQTEAYYNSWSAPISLAAFKSAYLFGSDDVTATFYNNGDLGLGREMHCRVNNFGVVKIIPCYVTNYSGIDNVAAFGENPATVLADAVNHQHEFATVAMVYREITIPGASTTSQVDFVAYNKAGTRVTSAQLDSTNAHSTIPNACLSCHGISAYFDRSTAVPRIVDPFAPAGAPAAKFLAFDPFSYLYSTVPGFTEADQRGKFRELNAIVRQTRPAPATVALIDGMYAPDPVTSTTAVANNDYVPTGWANADASQDGNALYIGAVKPGCRMCHASATNPSLDFLELADWAAQPYQIRSLVCGKTSGGVRGHAMPQAEHVSKVFWKTGARALILGYTQPHQASPLPPPGSPPGTPPPPPYPDLNASCDP
jgi:hypothetical protein